MKKVISIFIVLFISHSALALDWNAATAPIEIMYIYPDYAVIVQGGVYAGTSGCTNDGAWSFSWSDFDEQTASRIYSMLLAAKMSQAPIKPVFSDGTCGPENKKKFSGYFSM